MYMWEEKVFASECRHLLRPEDGAGSPGAVCRFLFVCFIIS